MYPTGYKCQGGSSQEPPEKLPELGRKTLDPAPARWPKAACYATSDEICPDVTSPDVLVVIPTAFHRRDEHIRGSSYGRPARKPARISTSSARTARSKEDRPRRRTPGERHPPPLAPAT